MCLHAARINPRETSVDPGHVVSGKEVVFFGVKSGGEEAQRQIHKLN